MHRLMMPVTLMLCITACGQQAVHQGAYEAAYQKGCMDQAGRPNCDPSHPDYETYQRQRDALIKR